MTINIDLAEGWKWTKDSNEQNWKWGKIILLTTIELRIKMKCEALELGFVSVQ